MFDSPLTYVPLVAPSIYSTPVAPNICDSTFFPSPLPLAQYTGLEIEEISMGAGSVLEDTSLLGSKELILGVPHLEEAPVMECDGDVVWDNDTHSIAHIDPICPELFDSTPSSSPVLPPPPSIACLS